MNWNNLTPQVLQYIRIASYALSSALVQHGLVEKDASWLPSATGALIFLGTLGWTIYGTRIQAKVNEVANYKITTEDGKEVKLVEAMKVNDAQIAQAAPVNVTPTKDAQ